MKWHTEDILLALFLGILLMLMTGIFFLGGLAFVACILEACLG